MKYICFLITTECNLNCSYCYRLNSEVPFMSNDDFVVYLSKLKELGSEIINITGGEPLLHPSWRTFINYASEMKFKITPSTNTLLLDFEDPILNKIDILMIPLDGSREEINQKSRGKFHFAKALSIIQRYKEGNYPFKLKINTVMTMDNYEDLCNISSIISSKNIYWRIFFCKQKGERNHLPRTKLVNYKEYVKKINELYNQNPNVLLMYDECLKDANENIVSTIVTPDGKLYLSEGEKNLFIGNLGLHSSKEILCKINNSGIYIEPYISSIESG